MYFRRSLIRFAKVEALASSIRLGSRYCHTGYVRPFTLSKYNELRKTKNFLIFSSTLRNFSSEYPKKNLGINMKALDFRSYNFAVKSTTKNRKEIGGNFHTKAPKSLTLKMCKQPSKSISTYPSSNAKSSQSDKKAKDASKEDICSTICNPNVSIPPTKPPVLKTSLKSKSPERVIDTLKDTNVSIPPTASSVLTTSSTSKSRESVIDKLTDAEIEEICRTRCPCKNCHKRDTTNSKINQTPTNKKHKNETSSSWYTKQTEDYEDPLTTTKTKTNIRKKRIDESNNRTRKMIVQDMDDSVNTAGVKTINFDDSSSQIRDFMSQISKTSNHHQQPFPRYPTPGPPQFDSRKANEFQHVLASAPMRQREYSSKRQLKSKYMRMIRTEARPSKRPSIQFQPRPQQMIHPVRMNLGFQPSNTNNINPNIGFPRYPQFFQVNPVPLGFRPINENFQLNPVPLGFRPINENVQLNPVPLGFRPINENNQTKQVFGNHFPRLGYKNVSVPYKSISNFKQLDPPPQLRPIYDKSFYARPASGQHFPRFDYKLLGVPYKSANKLLIRRRQRTHQTPPVYGSQIRRNKQSLYNLQSNIPNGQIYQQSNLPKWDVDQTKFANDIVNINKNTTNIGGGSVTSIPNNLLNMNLDKNKPQIVDLPPGIFPSETFNQSKKIDLKLIDNQSVIIDGPQKFKLITLSYPQLRDKKDVLIQMEYVNLTDADLQHYLTGKYSPYSYATTTFGRIGSGTVIEMGNDVSNVKIGDKVFIKPVSCGKCSLCLSDRRNLCEYVTASEQHPQQGTLSRLHVHPSEFITKIPDNVNLLNAAASTWTLSCAIRACQKANILAGDTVLILGGGPLGTATALVAMSMGATTACLSDKRGSVIDEAQKVGVNNVFLIDPKSPTENTAIQIWEHIGEYPRLTFDCSGSQFTNQIAIEATKTGGKVIVMNKNDATLPISNVVARDIDIIVSAIGNDESDLAALRYLSTGKISINNIMYTHYDLANVQEAFLHLVSPRRIDSQIVIQCYTKDDTQEKKEKDERK